MMVRRTFVGGLVVSAFGRACHVEAAAKPFRIGILSFAGSAAEISGPEPRRPSASNLLRGLRELGYVYGRDFVTEPRGAEGKRDLWPVQAAEMVSLKVDVIVAPGPYLTPLKRATSTIPIVMAAASDPVGDGFAQSLARPGGNFTGLSLQEIETTGKRLELLKELVPSASPVAVLWNSVSANSTRYWEAAEAAARKREWKLLKIQIRDASELERAFRTATSARAGALMTIASALLFGRARQLADLAAAHRLPAMYDLPEYVEAGGLIGYGADLDEIWRRAAAFVDKILKGASPAEIPIEQPAKFDLVLNLKTARELGLTVPPSLLARVDQLIE